MASAQEQPKPRRRWPLPRFSLAAALLAMTLCAVGLWYWYRVPFEVEHQISKARREVETVRRTWGGTVRHGPRHIYLNGKLFFVENYRDGVPNGPWEWLDGKGRTYISAEFQRGKLTTFHATEACDQRLARHLVEGTLTDPKLVKMAIEPLPIEFQGTPLKHALVIVQDNLGVPIQVNPNHEIGYVEFDADGQFRSLEIHSAKDRKILADVAHRNRMLQFMRKPPKGSFRVSIQKWDMPIYYQATDRPLIVVMGTMLQPHDLVCDYRYGMLWIAPKNEAEHWKDPTGLYAIVPPTGSKLESIWNERFGMEFIETPLGDVFDMVQDMDKVKFDTTRVPDSMVRSTHEVPVTLIVSGLPFKHCLGALLDRIDCQAYLDGETIVIELQPDHPLAENR